MGNSNNIKAKQKQILKDLMGKDKAKSLAAIKSLQSDGSAEILFSLAELLKLDPQEEIKEGILELFRSLKDSASIEVIMEILNDDENAAIRHQLLATVWNTKLDYSAYISDFVGIAMEGTFMETLECLTILENLEGPFEERHILESQLFLKEYLEDTVPKDPQKAQLISEIALLLQDWDRSIDAEM